MKITATSVYWLRIDLPPTVADAMTQLLYWDVIALRADTDAGISGWGYNCTLGEGSGALINLLERDLAPRFIGEDPFMVRKLWQEIYLDRHFTGITGIAAQGVAAIEIALWDMIAKVAGQPLWRLLGGYRNDRIPAYSTDGGWLNYTQDQLVANARSIKANGFAGFKMKLGKPEAGEDARRVAAVRDAVGPGYPIMVDANGRFDLVAARRAIAAIEAHDIAWFEEPGHPFDVAAHAALARSTPVPILAGETMYDPRMFRDFMVAGAMGIAQPDVLKLGGIAGWMDVAAMARAFGLKVVPAAHNMMQLDAHLMAATPNGLMMEHIPWLSGVFETPVRVENGSILVPHGPGAGTAISEAALRRYGHS